MAISQERYKAILNEINKQIKKDIPNYNLFIKERSKLMKFISYILFFNKNFSTNFTTTIYPNVYMPKSSFDNSFIALPIVCHEWIHLLRFKKYNSILMAVYYTFPQCLAALSLLSIFAIWFSNFWLLNLLWLVCLFPIPSPSRSNEEFKAYTMSMFVEFIETNNISKDTINFIANNFYGPNYYFMGPSKNKIIDILTEEAKLIRLGKYDQMYPFNFVKQTIEKERMIK